MFIDCQSQGINPIILSLDHAADTRIGLMDSTVPIEAMLGIPQD